MRERFAGSGKTGGGPSAADPGRAPAADDGAGGSPASGDPFGRRLCAEYRRALLENIMPFWEAHAPDREHGGFISSLDRDGSIVDTDKSVWVQGRMAWMFSSLHLHIEPRPRWLELAASGVDFLEKHCFDPRGKMYFLVTREGRPLRMRRHFFSEAFGVAAFAAYSRAAGSKRHAKLAIEVFEKFHSRATGQIPSEPKWDPATRPLRGLAVPMITLWTAQELRRHLPAAAGRAEAAIDWALAEITGKYYRPDLQVLLETTGPHGEFHDTFDGRLLNPGHALEAAWFMLEEAKHRGDADLRKKALNIADWMWQRGWDEAYGGVIYFRDVDGKPIQEYWHDMKFWWPQNETELAMLSAWRSTGEDRFRARLEAVHQYQFGLFPDPEYGEWFGYFHRDGRLSSTLKGNHWKSAFHIPRMLLQGILWLEEQPMTAGHPARTTGP